VYNHATLSSSSCTNIFHNLLNFTSTKLFNDYVTIIKSFVNVRAMACIEHSVGNIARNLLKQENK